MSKNPKDGLDVTRKQNSMGKKKEQEFTLSELLKLLMNLRGTW
jgi:hypothetical protein